MGVFHAAIRKLGHELGIKDLDVNKFAFVTRVHYAAADVVTHAGRAVGRSTRSIICCATSLISRVNH